MKRSLIAGASTLALVMQMSVPALADTITIKESATSTGKTYVYSVPSGESLAPMSVAQYGSYYVLCTSTVGTTKTSKILKIDTVNGSTIPIALGTTDTLLDATAVGKYFCILSSNGTSTKIHVLDMSVGSIVEVVNTKSVANALAKLSDTEVTIYYADGTTEVRNLATGAYGSTGAGLGVKDFDRIEGISFTPKFTATASYLGGTAFAGSADGKFYLYIKDANNTVPVSNTNNTGNTNNGTSTGNINNSGSVTTSTQTVEQAKAIIAQNYNSISSIIGNSTSESTVKSYLLTGVTSKDIVINTYNPQITRATSNKKGTFKLTAIVSSATNVFSPVTYNINQSIPKLNSSSSSSSSSSSGNITDDMEDARDKVEDFLDDYKPSNKSKKDNIKSKLKDKTKKYDVKIKIEDWDLDEADDDDEGNLSFTVVIEDEDDDDNYIEIDYDEDFDEDDDVDSIDKTSSSSSSSSTSETATNKVTSSSSSSSTNSSTATNKVNTSNVVSTANTATNASKNGWISEGGKWAYYEGNKKAYNKWVSHNGGWYYINASGTMATGWQQAGGKWYYLDSSGRMITGWQQLGGRWYLFETSGSMATGWKQVGGKWYFLNSDGAMATGWKQVGGKWYYLDSSGKMLANTIVGGYKLGSDGAMK